MRRILIVRHGNTFAAGEAPRRVGSRTDLPLVESGLAQGRALGAAFAARGWAPDRVITGPLQRARQTAGLILEGLGSAPVPEVASFLDEIDHGPDEDQSEEKVVARIGHAALEAWDSEALPPPGWTIDRESRIAGWQALLGEASEGTTLLVTSNGAARFVFLAAPQLLAGQPAGSLKLRTGAWGELAVNADGEVRLISWDQRPN